VLVGSALCKTGSRTELFGRACLWADLFCKHGANGTAGRSAGPGPGAPGPWRGAPGPGPGSAGPDPGSLGPCPGTSQVESCQGPSGFEGTGITPDMPLLHRDKPLQWQAMALEHARLGFVCDASTFSQSSPNFMPLGGLCVFSVPLAIESNGAPFHF
jgi:hypothetical protein